MWAGMSGVRASARGMARRFDAVISGPDILPTHIIEYNPGDPSSPDVHVIEEVFLNKQTC